MYHKRVNMYFINCWPFIKFIIAGGVNTLVSYVFYLFLLMYFGHKTSYSLAYLIGILLSFLLNKFFVFQSRAGLKVFAAFPFIYFFQYLFGLFVVWVWGDFLYFNVYFSPLVATILSLPITYLLSRFLFAK